MKELDYARLMTASETDTLAFLVVVALLAAAYVYYKRDSPGDSNDVD